MAVDDPNAMTPYSTVSPFFIEDVPWVPPLEQERIQSYETYERIYWSEPKAFRLVMRGTNDQPIYVPSARTVVNETAHYLLKGLKISPLDKADDPTAPLTAALLKFIDRERFYAKFHTAKKSGVVRGDWVMHITADPNKPEGSRLSINSVDPASYFPIYDEDDLDRIIGVDLVETIMAEDGKIYVKRLRYKYELDVDGNMVIDAEGHRTVFREEAVLELENWWDDELQEITEIIFPEEPLEGIPTIPVYHFKNIDWQGQPFGSSELRGFESLMGSINQTMSDEELSLALMGLGVYATDAPHPTDEDGDEEDWVIAPASVLEVPTGSKFEKVDGVTSVEPMQNHMDALADWLFEGSATFRTSAVDIQLAESGVALAIKFLPTLAKLEERDWTGVATLKNLWYDWKFWHKEYEGEDFTEQEIVVTLGDKLPTNRVEVLNELNNMLDRMVIDRKFYREQLTKRLGYEFPADMEQRVLKEQEALTKARMFESPVNGDNPNPSTANNSGRPNESSGTEADNGNDQ